MRLFIVAFIVCYFESCSSPSSNIPSEKEHTSEHLEKSDAVKSFAESVKNGKEVTIETAYLRDQIYDSTNSPSFSSKEYYFDVSVYLVQRGGAMLSSSLGKNILQLIETSPGDFCKLLDKHDSHDAENLGLTLGTYFLNHSDKPLEAGEKVSSILKSIQINKTHTLGEKIKRFMKLLYAGAKK